MASITQHPAKKGFRPKAPNPTEASIVKVRPHAEVHVEATTFDVFLAFNRRAIG